MKSFSVGHLDARGALTSDGLFRSTRQGDPVRDARETVVNGPEADLPTGVSYRDPDGHLRTSARLAWWKANREDLTWREAIIAETLESGMGAAET